ncbi:hypothetical protein [Aestuariivivens sediminis]|nr:hypothetical protein [Aestuariivivens sediminis]
MKQISKPKWARKVSSPNFNRLNANGKCCIKNYHTEIGYFEAMTLVK